MNIRFKASLLIAIFALPGLAQAADKATTAAVTGQAISLKAQAGGAKVISNNEQYQILPGVRAAESQLQESSQQTLKRVGGGKVVATKGAFVVFTAAPQGVASVMQANGVASFPTALNARTGGIGILPGTLKVKLKDMANVDAVAAAYGLDLVRAFAHLQAAFYRVKAGQDVVAAAAALSSDARVVSAEVEVIEHVKVPN